MVEVRQDEEAEEAVSRIRLVVEDADVAMPKVMLVQDLWSNAV